MKAIEGYIDNPEVNGCPLQEAVERKEKGATRFSLDLSVF
jgi:hypothetical protein